LWAEALKLDRVGREDNFFDLGAAIRFSRWIWRPR
jgi:hypothetical protein